MNPTQANEPQAKPASGPAEQPLSANTAKKTSNFDLNKILPKLKKFWQKLVGHFSFIVIIVVLLVYMLVVWQIRGLVTAEPSPEDESLALTSTNIPKIDKDAIKQIQSLEQNSPQVRTLFDEARNNPFHE